VQMMVTKGAKAVALVVLIGMVAACGLPRSGPNKKEIFAGSVLRKGDAFVVTVNSRVTQATAVTPSLGFSDSFSSAGRVGSDVISAGDLLNVTVYENVKDDPLLGNTGQRLSQLQELQVDGEGFIFIPYAGRIRAAGTSPRNSTPRPRTRR
jgi:polysaccharide biosynthesis/export protein